MLARLSANAVEMLAGTSPGPDPDDEAVGSPSARRNLGLPTAAICLASPRGPPASKYGGHAERRVSADAFNPAQASF